MTNPKLITALAEKGQVSPAQAKATIDAFTAKIAETLAAGDELNVSGLGRFKVKDVPARRGRNPQTGEQIDIPAKRKVVFSAAKALRDAVA